jgi:hypothetical protein
VTSARTTPPPTRPGLRAAPWLLWFGVLGGAAAWSLHTIVDWGINETVCRAGHTEMVGLPLRSLLGGLSLVFLLLGVVSLVVSYRLWRRLDRAVTDDDLQELRRRRAAFMAVVGVVANVLFVLMLACSAVAVLVLPACPGGP